MMEKMQCLTKITIYVIIYVNEEKIRGGNCMGASSYSSYSGKGSTNTSRSTTASRRTVREERSKSPMVEMLELLEEVERCRDVVASRQADLDSAKKDLERAEKRVSAQINKLDPETKARFRRIMGGLDSQEQEQDER